MKTYNELVEQVNSLTDDRDYFKDKFTEVCENLKCAQDQNHYFGLMGQYRDEKYIAENENKLLRKELTKALKMLEEISYRRKDLHDYVMQTAETLKINIGVNNDK